MNALDKKILLALLVDSRISLSSLAKKVKSSREVVTYRMKRLEKKKIIYEYMTHVDASQLGYFSAGLFLNVKTSREKELLDYLRQHPNTSWMGQAAGWWSMGTDIYGRSIEEIQAIFEEIHAKFSDVIINYTMTVYKNKEFYFSKLLGGKFDGIGSSKEKISLDDIDKQLLSLLLHDARCDAVKLAEKVNLSAPAVATRLKRLKKNNVIQNYSIFFDVSQLGYMQYSIFIKCSSLSEQKEMLSFLRSHDNVIFLVEYLGDPFIEIGYAIKDPYELRPLLQELDEKFEAKKNVGTVLIHKDILSVGPPECLFNNSKHL